jgi:hypothetical protein
MFILENPIEMDDLGVPPLFLQETPIVGSLGIIWLSFQIHQFPAVHLSSFQAGVVEAQTQGFIHSPGPQRCTAMGP